MSSVSAKRTLPAALSKLLNRTFMATLRLNPRPASLSDSMAIHQQINQLVTPLGKIVHYRQSICPVTKERLEKLQVLVEDFDPKPSRIDTVSRSETLTSDLTELERRFVERFVKQKESRIRLEYASRDPNRIMSLKFLQ